MILKDECKKVGLTVDTLSTITEVPTNTLRGWCKTRPDFMAVLFHGLKSSMILKDLDEEVRTLKQLEREINKAQRS